MRALITGGGGFIGSNLARGLLAAGHEVRVLDNFSTGRRENLVEIKGDIELMEGDIQSAGQVTDAVQGIDVVFHQAALPSVPRSISDPVTSSTVNVNGTLNVLVAARDAGVTRTVFASSSSVYGANPALPKEEQMATLPMSPYAVSKLAAEGYCRAFTNVYGMETVALRYFNVFGPLQDPTSQYAAVLPNFITAALEDRQPTIFGDGEQSRDFTFIENVVSANILAATAPDASGRTFNVACGKAVKLNEVIELIAELTGKTIEANYEDARTGDIRNSLADITAASEVLGYQPLVDFREGLSRTIDHFS
ncbi:MAG: SDR family oxidoreductase [Solirubrobacterales bacterium]|nr:SDR family oxidoreductase [Solirubrobacterales bacterium]